jgi:hypothetical protein
MKNFNELNVFEKKKMILALMGFEYIPHNSELNQKPLYNTNEGYFVLKQWLDKKHFHQYKFDVMNNNNNNNNNNTNHNFKLFGNVLPKNKFNPQSNWDDLFIVIHFLFNKEIFESDNGKQITNYNDLFKIISNDGEYKLDSIDITFHYLCQFIYDKTNK